MEWVPKYLTRHGIAHYVNLGDMSLTMMQAASVLDNVGWQHFTELKIALPLQQIYEFYFLHCLT